MGFQDYQDYYDFLGLDQKATAEEIKRAYREKIRRWHPDANPDRRVWAEEMSKTLNEAYSILGDSKKRMAYNGMMGFLKHKDLTEELKEEDFRAKLKTASAGLNKIRKDVIVLFQMCVDGIKGRYKLSPAALGLIGGALCYLLSAFDLVPDFLPLLGFTDDVAFLTMVISALRNEISAYVTWRKGA